MAKTEAHECPLRNQSNSLARLGAVVLALLAATTAHGSPDERAQIYKAEVLRQFVADDWKLARESKSQLVLQKPVTGPYAALVQALTNGSKGPRSLFQWTLTFTATSEHQTDHHAQAAITSRDAHGRPTAIPISTNPANKAYIDAKFRAADARMPAKYGPAKS